jgi:hypothetical protein
LAEALEDSRDFNEAGAGGVDLGEEFFDLGDDPLLLGAGRYVYSDFV